MSNLAKIPCSQTACMDQLTTPLYSVTAEEMEMETLFLLDQKIGPPSNMNTYPEVYFRSSLSPAQSESVNPTKSS